MNRSALGCFFGIYAFTYLTNYTGRRPAFAVSFVAAMGMTAYTFWNLREISQIFWMIPLMGFAQLSLFGGYAIYFAELFPTRLRSTGTSFCYNVGRFAAAAGPFTLGYLTSDVFGDKPEPMRYAGVAKNGSVPDPITITWPQISAVSRLDPIDIERRAIQAPPS